MLRKYILPILLVLTFLLAACGPAATPVPTAAPTLEPTLQPTAAPTAEAAATPASITLTDGLGREVTLTGPAQHIVSIAPSNTEILFAIGAGSQVAGRDSFSNFPAEAEKVTNIGGGFDKLNTEVILSLNPDLVLAADINAPEQIKALEDLGLTVFSLTNPTTLDEMYTNLRTVAQLTGHESDAETLITSLQERVKAVEEKVANVQEKPLVFYELDSTEVNAPWTSGPGTFVDLLISMAGGQNVGGVLSSAWAQISLEELVKQDPQVIVLGDATYGGVTPEMVKQRSGWEKIAAVKNDQVYPFDDNIVSRPGPRLVDGLEALAKLLHPELFQ